MRRFAALALAVLVLGACAPAPSGASVADDTTQVSLKIGFVPVLETLPLYVAERVGMYGKRNLTVELVSFRSAVERETALLTGQIDGEYTDVINAILLNKDQQRAQVVATLIRSTPEQPRFFVVAGKDSGVTGVSGLRGKDIATARNTIIDYASDQLLARDSLKPTDVNKQEVAVIPARLELLQQGRVAAATLPDPFRAAAVSAGGRVIADDGKDSLFTGVMVFSTDALKNKSSGVKRFLSALKEAMTDVNSKGSQYESLMWETANVAPPARPLLKVLRFPEMGVPTRGEIDPVSKWMQDGGSITVAADYAKLVTRDYLPN